MLDYTGKSRSLLQRKESVSRQSQIYCLCGYTKSQSRSSYECLSNEISFLNAVICMTSAPSDKTRRFETSIYL